MTVHAPDGVPEVTEGADLAGLLLAALGDHALRDGDVVAVTSKVVSKAEGRVSYGDRDAAVAAETARVVATRGGTRIVRTRLGLTMAAAGVDASNVEQGKVVVHPLDPDASARRLRVALHERTGANVGVVVTDTAGRAWRQGQTDIAIGAAGLAVLESYAGAVDGYGNELAVTEPAVADELASAAELAQGKLGARPFAVIRGRADLVLAPDDHGLGAVAMIRDDGTDLFGYGSREAVVRAVAAAPGDDVPFGSTASPQDLLDALRRAGIDARLEPDEGSLVCPADQKVAAAVLAFAHGWRVEPDEAPDRTDSGVDLRLRPATP
nr:coenzyme F420-0:L-glutamate ligase [Nocardioides thalensis]